MLLPRERDFIMEPGNRYRRWAALWLVMILCLLLMSLEIPIPHTTLAVAKNSMIGPFGKVKIMPLGDSITYGEHSSTGGGYRLPLWNELTARGANISFVGSMRNGPPGFDAENEGHRGWEIDQITSNVVNWLIAYRPDIILLHIGTNDIIKNDNPVQAPARLSRLIDQITITLPDAMLIVAQIIPLVRTAKLNAEVIAYNAVIPNIVQAKLALGKHVRYVDMYDAVPASLLPDGIHPNDTGYALMAKMWLRALLPLLNLSSGNRPFSPGPANDSLAIGDRLRINGRFFKARANVRGFHLFGIV